MEVLSGKSLERAFRLCDEKPGARVGIVCATCSSAQDFIASLWDEVSNGNLQGWEIGKDVFATEAVLRRRFRQHNQNHPETSYIEISVLKQSAVFAEKSYHLVLYESGMNEQDVESLAYAERLQFLDAEKDDGAELDKFLKSFKIV